jgi:hypothetical protein
MHRATGCCASRKRGASSLLRRSYREIIQAAKEWEEDCYMMPLKCIDGDMLQYFDDDLAGDYVELYSAQAVLEMMGRLKIK